jgi:hypothetical protein
MSKAEGKTPEGKESNYPTGRSEMADPPNMGESVSSQGVSSQPRPPSHSTEHFLIVNVLKGASKQDIVKAVEKALQSNDVPFLANSPRLGQKGISGMDAQATGQAANVPATNLKDEYPCPHDTLLMLVRQEGWVQT